ncbi:MAG: bifunctional folylpolyglutamate synthase/dihydrofolate synthase, partial [Pseudomonadota bacterium]
KGSCVWFADRLLRMAGQSVGRYTSPHLSQFNERIAVNGKLSTDAQLVSALDAVAAANTDIALTYFELTTLAALHVFAAAEVDARVLEIGLGGRLDAVNVVSPDVCLLTNVGLDHQRWLGDTVEEIGAEKAAVFRADVPAVVATRTPPDSVMSALESSGASPWVVGRHYDYGGGETWWWQTDGRRIDELPAVSGQHQQQNISAVLAALQAVDVLNTLNDERIREVVREHHVPGRLEWCAGTPEVLFDVAHNRESVGQLADWLVAHPGDGPTTMVIGAMQDKPVRAMLKQLAPYGDQWIAVAAPEARAMQARQMAQLMAQVTGQPALVAGSPAAGMRMARRLTPADGRIVVAGSFPVVGKARARL